MARRKTQKDDAKAAGRSAAALPVTGLPLKVHIACLLPVLVVAAGLFLRILGHDFLRWDDWLLIGENPRLQSPSLESLKLFWAETGTGFAELYTPLSYSFMWLLARVLGLRPEVFHAASILIHLVNTGLVYLIAVSLAGATGWRRGMAAAAVAAVFALHPLQVESVAWASSLNTLLACMFSLAGTAVWVVWAKRWPDKWIVPVVLTALFTLLACLCKPSAVVVPLLLALLDGLVLGRGWKHAAIPAVASGLAALPMAIIAAQIQPASNVTSPIWSRPLIALDAIGFYVAQMIAPVHLVSDYGRTPEYVLGHWVWPPYAAVAAGVIALVVLLYRRWPVAGWSLAMFVGALLPVLGLSTFQFQWYSTVADRYVYLPLAAGLPVLGILVAKASPRVVLAGGVAAVVGMGVRSEYALPVWKDTLSWAQHQIEGNPRSSAGYRVLAEHYVRAEDETRGEELYLKCLELRPSDTIVLYNLGNMRLRQGRADEAMDLYVRAINADSRNLGVYNNGFIAAQKTGRVAELGKAIAGTLQRNERNAYAHSYMGWVYLMDGNAMEARPHFERALELAPGLPSARNGMNKIMQAGLGEGPQS